MTNDKHRDVAGKSAGEVARNIAEFLSRTCVVQAKKQMDLANLLPSLNMKEQYAFTLLMEAQTQGWEPAAAENFFLRFCAPAVGMDTANRMLEAFRDPKGAAFRAYEEKYGCDFCLTSHAYWNSCFAVAADAKAVPRLMEYFQAFVFSILEFAYMGDRNPDSTYVWKYYDSFQRILSELSAPKETPKQPVVKSLGGAVGGRDADGYLLAFGLDVQNVNASHMAWNVEIDVTLKDREGKVISVIHDQINCIDPAGVFHYGITRKIHGNPVAHISASAKTGSFTKLTVPLMKHVTMERISVSRSAEPMRLNGTLKNGYDCPLHSFALHYQFLSRENKLLGGGCEWFFEEFAAGAEKDFSIPCPVNIKNAAKIVYSVDFNAQELLTKS